MRRLFRGTKLYTEDMSYRGLRSAVAVEERSCFVEVGPARAGGEARSENVGISNYSAGENPAHRKSKVSWAMIVSPGLVDPNFAGESLQGMANTVDIP